MTIPDVLDSSLGKKKHVFLYGGFRGFTQTTPELSFCLGTLLCFSIFLANSSSCFCILNLDVFVLSYLV